MLYEESEEDFWVGEAEDLDDLNQDQEHDQSVAAPSFREWGAMHCRTLLHQHILPPAPIRFMDVAAISTKWFGPQSVGSFGAGWWQAAQTRFLDHVEFVPGPIWATANRTWLWLAWARTYPLPIMSSRRDDDEPEQFGMWRPSPSCLTEYGLRHWSGADLDAYCTLWSHLWHRMRTAE